jgi:hypothetical protein
MLRIGFSFSGEEEIPFAFYEGFVRFLGCDLFLYVLLWLDHGGWIIAAEIMVWPIAIYLSGVDRKLQHGRTPLKFELGITCGKLTRAR